MTNKQFEKIGRAMVLVGELAARVEGLYPLRANIVDVLSPFCGREAASSLVDGICSNAFPRMHIFESFNAISNMVNKEAAAHDQLFPKRKEVGE